MKFGVRLFSLGLVFTAYGVANANLLSNGNLDVTYQQEITPGFFLPKPDMWVNEGSRAITGPYEDELSSEPWAGPAPTPVTSDGVNGEDWAVFFKPFSGNATDGAATGHLYQDNAASVGFRYTLTGWVGAEANAMITDFEFALEFLDAGGAVIGGTVLSLLPTLFVDNGESFDYKQYSVSATAMAGAVSVRSRVSMIGAMSNPAGGGQAIVADDFELTGVVPEPATMTALALGGLALLRRNRRSE